MERNIRRGSKPQADQQLLDALTERYRQDIEKLQTLLGRNLSGWMNKAG
jgi:HPt (histidine-containing phosphotransfer) domain-containing protein